MILYAASTNAFYDDSLMVPPADAVEITPARHGELLTYLSQGRTIGPCSNGLPHVVPVVAPLLQDLVDRAVAAVNEEAERRILVAAPIWRQCNDLAVIAELGWRPEQELDTDQAVALATSRTRRSWIDAVRTASNILGARLQTLTVADLQAFDLVTAPEWPEPLAL